MTEFKLFSPVKPAKNYIQIFNFLQNKIFIVSAYGTERIISILGKTTLRNIYRHAFRYTICSIEFMDIGHPSGLKNFARVEIIINYIRPVWYNMTLM